jgi:hypothetical protein
VVAVTRGALLVLSAGHHPGVDQPAEPGGQQVARDAKVVGQVIEAPGADGEIAQDQR